MYCLKCRRVTESENFTIDTSKNGRPIRRGQCIICGKIRLNLLKSCCWWKLSQNFGEQTSLRNAFARS